MEKFGEKLRVLRNQRRMTLQQLAGALGYTTHSYLSEIESGKKQPTIDLVLGVAQLFNVTTDELLKDHLELRVSSPKKKRISNRSQP
jgi:transcriptional regulator with XRE-family HTH domain